MIIQRQRNKSKGQERRSGDSPFQYDECRDRLHASNHFQRATSRVEIQIYGSTNGTALEKMSRVFTPTEVAAHDNENDLWLVYKDGVYDLTKFAKEHPGGEDVLIELAGKDGTKCFDDIGHTTEAVQLREACKIGVLSEPFPAEPSAASRGEESATIDDDNWEYTPPKNERSAVLPVFIAAGIAIYGILLYYFWFS